MLHQLAPNRVLNVFVQRCVFSPRQSSAWPVDKTRGVCAGARRCRAGGSGIRQSARATRNDSKRIPRLRCPCPCRAALGFNARLVFKLALIPAFSPGEKEKRSTVAGEFARSKFSFRTEAKSREAATAQETSEIRECTKGCSLSPGERVRMKASVHTIQRSPVTSGQCAPQP